MYTRRCSSPFLVVVGILFTSPAGAIQTNPGDQVTTVDTTPLPQWTSFVSLAQVRLACAEAEVDTSDTAGALRPWCNLRLDQLNALLEAELPPIDSDMIVRLAMRRRDSMVVTTRQLSATVGGAPPVQGSAPEVRVGPEDVAELATDLILSQGEILFGLTDFLLDQTRIELEGWAVPLMQKTICGEANGAVVSFREARDVARVGLGWALPSACASLTGSAALNLAVSPGAFFASVRDDLRVLPRTVVDAALKEWRQDSIVALPQVRTALMHARILYDFAHHVGKEPLSVARAFSLLSEYAQELTEVDADVSTTIHKLRQYAVVVQQLLNVAEADVLPADGEWVHAVRTVMINLALNSSVDDSARARFATLLFDVREIRQHLIHADESLEKLRNTPVLTADNDDAQARAQSIAAREASIVELMNHVVGVIQSATNGHHVFGGAARQEKLLGLMGGAVASMQGGDYARGVARVVSLMAELELLDRLPREGVRILTFAGDMARAKTSEEVTVALNALADAAAAREGKRADEHPTLLHLQGYGGATIGREGLWRPGGTFTDATSPSLILGPFFPVGLELTFKDCPIGLFVQMIDLGVLATARLSSDTLTVTDSTGATQDTNLERAPEVGFNQVLAPGLFLTVALKETPISWGVGAAYTPKLRAFANNQVQLREQRDAFRISMFVAVDIPIFP